MQDFCPFTLRTDIAFLSDDPSANTAALHLSADYLHIATALKSLWPQFIEMIEEMDAFVSRPISEYEEERVEKLAHFRKLNPEHSDAALSKFVNEIVEFSASDRVQFVDKFSAKFMSQYVTVAVLSHALCEAAINAILAIGLTQSGSPQLFAVLEKAEIKEKWRVGPKTFCPTYEFIQGTGISETLNHMTKRRNALVHNKIHLRHGEEKILEGSKFERLTFKENIRWMKRYFSLPYDLVEQASVQMPSFSFHVLQDRNPIVKAEPHLQ